MNEKWWFYIGLGGNFGESLLENYINGPISIYLMNYKDVVINKLAKFTKEDIVITYHAEEQAIFRGIKISEIKENIINPKRLTFARKQETEKKREEKFDCYFGYSKSQCQRYVLVINNKCVVCTVIKIKRRWQHKLEKNAKI